MRIERLVANLGAEMGRKPFDLGVFGAVVQEEEYPTM